MDKKAFSDEFRLEAMRRAREGSLVERLHANPQQHLMPGFMGHAEYERSKMRVASVPENQARQSSSLCGVVVIGRNEGELLKRCIDSIRASGSPLVYVDSGSTDGSSEWVRSQGIEVVDLNPSRSFTAARARNEGVARLLTLWPDIGLIQFVDGDCEVAPGWVRAAVAFMSLRPDVAVVSGRLRERHPEASIFNAQCDREWNPPVGEAKACGGNAMFRRAAFEQVGGYRNLLIAGEEPELCLRVRAAGWRVWSLGDEMALHDVAILRWSQWWKRTRRTGHAYAQVASMHSASTERFWVLETERAMFWGVGLPIAVLVASVVWHPAPLVLLLIYPLQALRLAWRAGITRRASWDEALLLVLSKFPEGIGAISFWFKKLMHRQSRWIEYK